MARQEAIRFEDQALDFVELRDRARRVANGLTEHGLKKGDRIAVLLRNGLEWVEMFLGISGMGAVCVPVNILLKPSEVEHLCHDSQATAFVVDEHSIDLLEDSGVVPDLVVTVGEGAGKAPGKKVVRFEDLMLATARPHDDPPTLDDDLILYYSSGTTGLPKAAVHTHNGVLWNSYSQLHDLKVTRNEVYLVVPSFSWAAGFHNVTLAAMWVGARSVVLPNKGMSMERILDAAESQGGTKAQIVPTLLRQLLAHEDNKQRLRKSTLRYVLTGAEPVPLPMIQQFQSELPEIDLIQGYGMSEFPTVASILEPEDAVSRAGWAGRATSTTRLAVLDFDGNISDTGEGEVLLRSPATMSGYWNRPEQNAEAFADGWLHSGDVGMLDEQGFLKLTGRKKDMIISGGLNVYPKEAEDVIHQIAGVEEAVVVGVSDPEWGEISVAVLVADKDSVAPDKVVSHCRKNLATYKVPKQVLFHDGRFPRNASGKVLKREIQPWAASELGRES